MHSWSRTFIVAFWTLLVIAATAPVDALGQRTRDRQSRIDGGPVPVGPEKPSATVAPKSLYVGVVEIEVTSSDGPTAMRLANSVAELASVPWVPFQERPQFALNGQFPEQVVVQVAKPAGPSSHPVHGPHVASDPIRTTITPERVGLTWRDLPSRLHVVSWTSSADRRSSPDEAPVQRYGTLTLRFDGLGSADELQFNRLYPCQPNYFERTALRVRPVGGGSFLIELDGRWQTSQLSDVCFLYAEVLGKGGNFEPGVVYQWRDVDRQFRTVSAGGRSR